MDTFLTILWFFLYGVSVWFHKNHGRYITFWWSLQLTMSDQRLTEWENKIRRELEKKGELTESNFRKRIYDVFANGEMSDDNRNTKWNREHVNPLLWGFLYSIILILPILYILG